VIYQHPLAYVLGLEGVALLRAFCGEQDQEFVLARIDEIRQLVQADRLVGDGVEIPPVSTVEAYGLWAETYDQPGNALIELEQPIIDDIIDAIPAGIAVDVGCGTGRHARHLAERGNQVIGLDSCPEMLMQARAKVPGASFIEGDLCHLPLGDDTVDIVVCALVLTHIPDLQAPMAEFVRVLRPGGDLVISDSAGLAAGIRPPIVMTAPDGRPGYLPHRNRRASDYLSVAVPLGLQVRRCEEPRLPQSYVDPDLHPSIDQMLPDGPPNIWMLHHWFPQATNAALQDIPVGIVWHFHLEDRSAGCCGGSGLRSGEKVHLKPGWSGQPKVV
jgi:SAM-dependent methyltransferase